MCYSVKPHLIITTETVCGRLFIGSLAIFQIINRMNELHSTTPDGREEEISEKSSLCLNSTNLASMMYNTNTGYTKLFCILQAISFSCLGN